MSGRSSNVKAMALLMEALPLTLLEVMLPGICACGVTRVTAPPPAEVRTVEVPVALPCRCPSAPSRPRLPLADVPDDAPREVVLKAFVASLEVLTGYAKELELASQSACGRGVPHGEAP